MTAVLEMVQNITKRDGNLLVTKALDLTKLGRKSFGFYRTQAEDPF